MIPVIYTIGYKGKQPGAIKRQVDDLGAYLVDIRLSARSAFPQYRQAALIALVGAMNYRHIPELGNVNFRTGGPIELADPVCGLTILCQLWQERPVILLCACVDWTTCHRRAVAGLLVKLAGDGVKVEHLV